MAWEVQFLNGINYDTGGTTLLNSLISDLINQTNYMQDINSIVSDLSLTPTQAISTSQKFSAIVWPVELDRISENGIKAEQDRSKTPDKGYDIREYGGKLTVSYLMSEWIRSAKPIEGASADVKQGWMDFMNNGRWLLEGSKFNLGIDAISLLTKAFSISTANGAGSPTPKGKSMFATDHKVRNNTISFRNVLTTPNQALASASLQDALNIHKTELRLDNGYRTKLPSGAFELWVSRRLATAARILLNTEGNKAGIFSGVANNANQLNQFNFQGNLVSLKEIPLMGDTDKNGAAIGSDTMWYLVNPDTLRNTQGFRIIKLYEPKVKNYINNETDAYVSDIRLWFAIDHFWAEASIVGSLWTV